MAYTGKEIVTPGPKFTPREESNPFTPAPPPANPYDAQANKNVFSYWDRTNGQVNKPNSLSVYLWGRKGENLNPGIYNPQIENQTKKPYWSEPGRVVRFKQLLDNTPPEIPVPDWLDKQKVNALYNYLEFQNPGKKAEDWTPIRFDDPNYGMVETLTSPPQDLLPFAERDPATNANAVIESWQKRYADQYAEMERLTKNYNEEFASKYADDTIEQNKVDFSKLEPLQQFLVATQGVVPGEKKPEWMKTVEAGSMGVKTGMGAMSTIGMFTAIVGAASTAGSSIGPIGTGIGFGVGLGAGIYAYVKAKSGDIVGANAIMSAFNKPAEWTEQLAGAEAAKRQLAAYGADVSKIKYKDFFNAGKSYYESNYYELGNLETDLISKIVSVINPNWSSGRTTKPGEVWQIQKGIVEPQLIRQGTLAGNVMAEAAMRLHNGEESTSVYEDIVDRYGYSGTKADFILQSWVDPMQYVPFLVTVGGEVISGSLKNQVLAESFRSQRGNLLADAMPGSLQMPVQIAINLYNRLVLKNTPDGGIPKFINFRPSGGIFDVMDDYRYVLRTSTAVPGMEPIMADKFTNFDRWIAGTDKKTGIPKELMGDESQGQIAARRTLNMLTDKTPLAKTALLKDNMAGALENLWERSGHDTKKFVKEIGKVVAGKASVVAGDYGTYYYDSPEARSIAGAFKASLETDRVKNLITAWDTLSPQRSVLKVLSDGLGISGEDVLARIRKNETSDLLKEFVDTKLTKNKAMTELADQINKGTMDPAIIKSLFRPMIRDRIPVEQEMMFSRLSQEIDMGMTDHLVKYYGIPKDDAMIFKVARLNKSIQSLVLLGLNPTFLVKNFLNNVSTMTYQRVGGLYSEKLNKLVYQKFDIHVPVRASDAHTMIGLRPDANELSKNLIDKAQYRVNKLGGAALASNASMKVEQNASESIVATGVYQVMSDDWLSGKAITPIPPELATELRTLGYKPEDLFDGVRSMAATDLIANGPSPKASVEIKLNKAVEQTFTKLGIDPAVGTDLIAKTGMIEEIARHVNEENMTMPDAVAAYQRTYETETRKLLNQEIVDQYAENAALIKGSGMPAGVHIIHQLQLDEVDHNATMQQRLADMNEEVQALRSTAHSAKDPEQKRLYDNAYAVYNIRHIELLNEMQQHAEMRLNAISPVLNALHAEIPEQATYIKALASEHRAYIKYQSDKLEIYNDHYNPDPEIVKQDWNATQAKIVTLNAEYAQERAEARANIRVATVTLFGDNTDAGKRAAVWLDQVELTDKKISAIDKRFNKKLAETHGKKERNELWQQRNKAIMDLERKTIDYDYDHANAINKAILQAPPPPEEEGATPKGRYVMSPTGERVWVANERPKAADQPALPAFGKEGYRHKKNPISKAYTEKGGWKLNLTVSANNYAEVDEWLYSNYPGPYKLLSGGEAGENDFTIYVGSMKDASELAVKIDTELHDLIEPNKSGGTYLEFNERVSGRFDLQHVKDNEGFKYYGQFGVPFDDFAQSERVAAHAVRSKPDPEIMKAHVSRIDRALAKKYGEYYTGVPESKTVIHAEGIPVMITNKMKATLASLGYAEEAINGLTPTRAWEIISDSKDAGTKPLNALHQPYAGSPEDGSPWQRVDNDVEPLMAEGIKAKQGPTEAERVKAIEDSEYFTRLPDMQKQAIRQANFDITLMSDLHKKAVKEFGPDYDANYKEATPTGATIINKGYQIPEMSEGVRESRPPYFWDAAEKKYVYSPRAAQHYDVPQDYEDRVKIGGFTDGLDADAEKRLININRIDEKYRGGWVQKNSAELGELRDKLRKIYHLTDDASRATVGIMCAHAEEVTFRTKEIDPMVWMRRYEFEAVTDKAFAQATPTGIKSAGAGMSAWDAERGKWVVAASQKANPTTWLHEMAHTWIFDLDETDLNVLAKWSGFTNAAEFMAAEQHFRNYKIVPLETPDALYMAYSKAQEQIVSGFEQIYMKNKRELHPLQMSTVSPSIARGFRGLMVKFRDWVISLYKYIADPDDPTEQGKYKGVTGQAHWMPTERISTWKIPMSDEVIAAMNHLSDGYRKDEVWLGNPNFEHLPVSHTYMENFYSDLNGGKHIDVTSVYGKDYSEAATDMEFALDLESVEALAQGGQRQPVIDQIRMTPIDEFVDPTTVTDPERAAIFAQQSKLEAEEAAALEAAKPKKEWVRKVITEPALKFGKNDDLDIAVVYYDKLPPTVTDYLIEDIKVNSSDLAKLEPGKNLYAYAKANNITQEQLTAAIKNIAEGRYNPDNKLQFNLMFRAVRNSKYLIPELRRFMNLTITDRFYNQLDFLDQVKLKPLQEMAAYGFDPSEGYVKKHRYLAKIEKINEAFAAYDQLFTFIRKEKQKRAKTATAENRSTYLEFLQKQTKISDVDLTKINELKAKQLLDDWKPGTAKTRAYLSETEITDLLVLANHSKRALNKVLAAYEDYQRGVHSQSVKRGRTEIIEANDVTSAMKDGGMNMLVDNWKWGSNKPAPVIDGLNDPNIPYELTVNSGKRWGAESSYTPEQKIALQEFLDRTRMQETNMTKAEINSQEYQDKFLLEKSKILEDWSKQEQPVDGANRVDYQSRQDEDLRSMLQYSNEAVIDKKVDNSWRDDPFALEKEIEEAYLKTGGKGDAWDAALTKARNARRGLLYEYAETNDVSPNRQEMIVFIQSVLFPKMNRRDSDIASATWDAKMGIVNPNAVLVDDFHRRYPNAMQQPDPGELLHNPIESAPATFKQGKAMKEMMADIAILTSTLREYYDEDKTNYSYKFADKLSPEGRALFDKWISDTQVQLGATKEKAIHYGLAQRDASLLNYADRTGLDTYMDWLMPYQFWFTRSMKEWVKRSLNRPAILALAGRRQEMAEKLGKNYGTHPMRLQGKYKIPWAFAEKWMGSSIYVNPWQDLMPVNQLLQPLNMVDQAVSKMKPDFALQEMVSNKEITQEQMDAALAGQNGPLLTKALEIAKTMDQSEDDPYAMLSMMMTPNWLINEVEARISKRKLPNMPLTNLGLTIESHADTIGNAIGKSDQSIGNAVKDVLSFVGKVPQVVEKGVRYPNFAYYGQWGNWLVKRELSNMAAEGEDVTAIMKNMIEGKGDLWAKASKRVRDQVSLKTPGSLLARSVEEGDLSDLPWAIVATLFPAGIFPEGEMLQLGLKEDMQKAWREAAETGDKTMMNDWFKEHPEYIARAALNDDDETMLKKFLINQIMDSYTSEEGVNKSLIKEHLGDDFINAILDPDTKSGRIDYPALDLTELVGWARSLKRTVPSTPELDAIKTTTTAPDLLNPVEVGELTTYFDERTAKFPDHQQLNEAYSGLNTSQEKDIFLAKYPELKAYWDWSKVYKTNNPTVEKWVKRYSDPNAVAEDPYFGLDPNKIQAYYDYKEQNFPNVSWLNNEYFKLDEKNYSGKKAFLNKHPELKGYWDWKDKAEQADPEYRYYNQMQDAMFTKKSFEVRKPSDLKPAQVAQALAVIQMDGFVKQDLLDYYVRGTELPYGTRAYLNDLWEQRGKPGESLKDFIDNLF